jgi:hypothetical protein
MSLLRSRGRREDNTRTDLRDTGCEDVNWIREAQDRVQWRAAVVMVTNIGLDNNRYTALSSLVDRL